MTLTFSRMFRLLAIFLLALAFSVPSSRPLPARAATITVDTLTDETDGSCSDGDCSLRDAMLLAESKLGPDTIDFGVAGTITLARANGTLPQLQHGSTVIDGTTAPGYAGTPVVAIDGSNLNGLPDIQFGIAVYSDGNSILGLFLHSFEDGCIEMEQASANTVEHNTTSSPTVPTE
jgi:CSLREA domain-containing protein